MAIEDTITTRLSTDATLIAILTGGIYARGALGREGLTRETKAAAFDSNGYLKPTAVVAQRALVPDGNVQDQISQQASAAQIVEIYLYEDKGYTNIDAAMNRIYVLLQGYQFADIFPLEWANTVDRQRDTGALDGASMARIDFAVYQVRSS